LAFNEAGLSEEKLGLLPGTGTGDAVRGEITISFVTCRTFSVKKISKISNLYPTQNS